jgi:hypothetical protein
MSLATRESDNISPQFEISERTAESNPKRPKNYSEKYQEYGRGRQLQNKKEAGQDGSPV